MTQPPRDELVEVNINAADGDASSFSSCSASDDAAARNPFGVAGVAAAAPARGGGQLAGPGSVQVDVADSVGVPGPARPQRTVRYTPITMSQEEVIQHGDSQSELRALEDMLIRHRGDDQSELRQKFATQFAPKAELVVGITMHQEPIVPSGSSWSAACDTPGNVCATIDSVAENLETIYRSNDSRMGPEGAVVALVADGRNAINRANPENNPENLRRLQELGVYFDIDELYSDDGPLARAGRLQARDLENRRRDGQAATRSRPKYSGDGGNTVYLHLFEAEVWYRDHQRPMQFMFCLKEFSAGKLDSHLWLFELFTAHFHRTTQQEVYTVLLDAGAVLGPGAVRELVECMRSDALVAGCYGDVVADTGPATLCNPLVACQAFEYASMNFRDKLAQPLFGHAEELPGGLSAYRWTALDRPSQTLSPPRPLECYFETLTRAGQMSLLQGHAGAAADRKLGCRLVLGAGGRLAHVPTAAARVPIPDRVGPYLSQRRRWLNGSQFAMLYPFRSGLLCKCRNPLRMLSFVVELLYMLLSSAVSWFSLGNTFLCSFLFVRAVCGVGPLAIETGRVSEFLGGHRQLPLYYRDVFMGMFTATLVLAMGSRPNTKQFGMKLTYRVSAVLWGLVVMMAFCLAVLIMAGHVTGVEAVHATETATTTETTLTTTWDDLAGIMKKSTSTTTTETSTTTETTTTMETVHVALSGLRSAVGQSAVLSLLSLVAGGLLSCNCRRYSLLCLVPYMIVQPTMANLVQTFALTNLNDLPVGDDDTRNGFRCVMVLLWLSTNSLLMAVVCTNDFAQPGTGEYEQHMKVELDYLFILARTVAILSVLRLACVGLFYVGAGALVSNKGRRRRPTNQQQVPLVNCNHV